MFWLEHNLNLAGISMESDLFLNHYFYRQAGKYKAPNFFEQKLIEYLRRCSETHYHFHREEIDPGYEFFSIFADLL